MSHWLWIITFFQLLQVFSRMLQLCFTVHFDTSPDFISSAGWEEEIGRAHVWTPVTVNCSFKGRGSQCILIISIWTRSQSAALKCKEEMMNSSSQALIPLILQAESLCCMMMNVNVVSNRLLCLIKHQTHQKGMKYEFYRVKTRRDFQQCGHLRTLGKVLFIEDT